MLTAAISEPMPTPDTQPPSPAIAGNATDVLAFPASVAQQMFWYLEHLQGTVTAFNVPLRFSLTGTLDARLLELALNALIERHEVLRTRFGEADGELLQIVSPELKLSIPLIDISHLPKDRIDEEANRLGSIEAHRPFDLSKGPLLRAEILRLGPESHVFHFTVHHAVFDGMSMTVFGKEIAEFYQAFLENRPPGLEPLAIQYGDYSVWQKEFLQGPRVKEQLEYWKKRLKGMTELELPTDFPRPPVKSWKGDITSILLPKELSEKLQTLAAAKGATLFHVHLAAFMILLRRYSGSLDIAVGAPVAGRSGGDLEPLIGVFINTLILRSDLSGNPGFLDYLSQIRESSLEALENQELPFEHLVHELRPERDPSRNPLFQVNFNHHRSFTATERFGGLSLTTIPSRSPGAIFDLHLFLVERDEGWRASCDFSTDLFTRTSADRLLGRFKRLLEDIADHPEKSIEQLEILTDSEKQQLQTWSEQPLDYPRDATIGSLFLETATRYPDRTALVCKERNFTYQQLRAESTRLAATLIESGVKPGDAVAISAGPGPEMIKGLLAILLAGGCCVPIDPSYPADRFALLLDECGAMTALATPECANVLPTSWKGRLHTIETFGNSTAPVELPQIPLTAGHPAHLLFTSGSTGRPKGVLLPHRGTVRLVRNNDFIKITPDDVFLQAAPVSFDASLLEIYGALLNGGRLILLPDGPGLESIAAAVRDQGVTTLWLTSGLFQLMIDEQADSLKGLRYLLAGGDVLSTAHVRKALDALPGTKLINGYGPTENTTFTTCHTITREDLAKPSIPIGKPIANTTVHLLDDQLRQVPVGIPGELCTGGDGLAIGYLNAPELTAEKFITHPDFGRLYRTGDLCRRATDGTIEFLARRDHQVKVRGFRIELGEIEAVLASHPLVRQSKATVRGDSAETKRILAWVVPADGHAPTPEELASYLAKQLPGFMQPDGIAVIDAFPLNANGKIQLSTLPDPGHRATTAPDVPFELPTGHTETHLAAIWQELLGVSGIGRNDDFFALGGHSLMALRMFSRINREFNKSLPLATLIQHPTIAKLATMLEPPPSARPAARPLPGAEVRDKGNIVTLAEGGSQRPLFCIHGGDGGVIFYRGLAALIPKELPLHAIESRELGNSGKIEQSSIEETAAAYVRKILTIQPEGPFRLAGYSFGGVVAHEMACQLTDIGQQVEFLGMFDTHNPAAPSRTYSMAERLGVFWKHSGDLPPAQRVALLRARIGEGIQTNRRIRAELKSARSSGPAEAFSDLRRVQIREENWRAMKDYQPRPFNGRITLFKTSFVNDKVERSADYGWSDLALSGLDIVSVSGHHLALFAPEHIESLAEALVRSLKRSARPAS
jgi:amino acid adenylation domain-containing protein